MGRSRLQKTFSGGTARLAGGAAVGQLIGLAIYPIITRLYTPQDVGILAVYTSIVGIVGVVGCLRYEQAIVLPYAARDALAIAVLSLVSAVFVSLMSSLMLLVWPPINPAYGLPQQAFVAAMVPVGIFAVSLYMIANMLALRMKLFSPIGRTRIIQAVLGASVQLGGAPLGLGAIPLVVGQVTSQSSGAIGLGISASAAFRDGKVRRSIVRVRYVARRYRKFVLVGTPSAALNTAGLLLGPVLVSHSFGIEKAGYFGLATLLLSAPVQLVGKSSAQVFFTNSAKRFHANRATVKTDLRRLSSRLALMCVAPVCLVAFFAPWLFSSLFGAIWEPSGRLATVLVVPYALAVVSAPAAQVFLLAERQELSLYLNALKVVAPAVGLLVLPAVGQGFIIGVGAYAIILSVYYAAVLVVALKLLGEDGVLNAQMAK